MRLKGIFKNRDKFQKKFKAVELPVDNDNIFIEINNLRKEVLVLPIDIDIDFALKNDLKITAHFINPDINIQNPKLVSRDPIQIPEKTRKIIEKSTNLDNLNNSLSQTILRINTLNNYAFSPNQAERTNKQTGENKNEVKFNNDFTTTSERVFNDVKQIKNYKKTKIFNANLIKYKTAVLDKMRLNAIRVVKTKNIDYKSKIPSDVLHNSKKSKNKNYLRRKRFFAKKKTQNRNRKFTSRLKNIDQYVSQGSTRKLKDINDVNASSVIDDLYNKAIDPAIIFESKDSHKSIVEKVRNRKNKSAKNGNTQRSILQDFTATDTKNLMIFRDRVVGRPLSLVDSTQNVNQKILKFEQPSIDDMSTVVEPVIGRETHLNYIFKVNVTDDIVFENKIHIELHIVNRRNVLVSIKKIEVDLLALRRKDLLCIKSYPTISVAETQKRNVAIARITNPNNKNINFKIYVKHIKQNTILKRNNFEPLCSGIVLANQTLKLKLPKHRLNSLNLYRMTWGIEKISSDSQDSIKLNNFVTTSLKNFGSKNFKNGKRFEENINFYAVNAPDSESKGKFNNTVNVFIDQIPRDVIKLRLLRAKTTKQQFKAKNFRLKNLKLEPVINTTDKDKVYSEIKIRSVDKEVILQDTSLTKEGLYVYALQIFRNKKVDKISNKKFAFEFKKPDNRVVSEITRESKNNYRVKIKPKKPTFVDSIVEEIETISKDLGNFKEEIDNIKTQTNNTRYLKAKLVDVTTGKETFLGKFTNGEKINIAKHTNNDSEKYRFVAESYESNISNSVNLVNKFLKKASLKKDISPAALTKIESLQEQCGKFNDSKFRNKPAGASTNTKEFIKNNKLPPSNYFNDSLENIEEKTLKTNDVSVKSVETPATETFDFKNQSIEVSACSKVLLTFSILSKSMLENIDFLIISAIKEGIEVSVGPAFCDRQSAEINFLDFTNQNYFGEIKYHVTPVYKSGNLGKKLFIGTLILTNKPKK